MELTEKAEEILESLWIQTEEEKHPSVPLDQIEVEEKESVEQLLEAGYVLLSDGNISLSSRGRPFARNVVRRHRLAERLLVDVLGAADRQMHEKACKFEHILDRGLDESICSLLGHPKVCPHGKPIPPGRCCRQRPAQTRPLVTPLSQFVPGQEGKVAYIYAPESDQLQKLVAMGVLPGAPISLIQSFPSYVFQMHQTQFAVDKEIAEAIYVRLVEDKPAIRTEETSSGHRWGWRKLRPRFRRGHPKMRQRA